MEQSIKLVKQRIADGETSFSPDILEQLERMIASDRPKMVMNGMRGVRADEIEPQ